MGNTDMGIWGYFHNLAIIACHDSALYLGHMFSHTSTKKRGLSVPAEHWQKSAKTGQSDTPEGQEEERNDRGLVGVFMLILLGVIVFFFVSGFVKGIFDEMNCTQAKRDWNAASPKRYIMRLIGEEIPDPNVDEQVYMFGACVPRPPAPPKP